jgi:hypothetical protein
MEARGWIPEIRGPGMHGRQVPSAPGPGSLLEARAYSGPYLRLGSTRILGTSGIRICPRPGTALYLDGPTFRARIGTQVYPTCQAIVSKSRSCSSTPEPLRIAAFGSWHLAGIQFRFSWDWWGERPEPSAGPPPRPPPGAPRGPPPPRGGGARGQGEIQHICFPWPKARHASALADRSTHPYCSHALKFGNQMPRVLPVVVLALVNWCATRGEAAHA